MRGRRHARLAPIPTTDIGEPRTGWCMPGNADDAFVPHPGVRLLDPGFDEITAVELIDALPALARTAFWRGVPADPTGPRQ